MRFLFGFIALKVHNGKQNPVSGLTVWLEVNFVMAVVIESWIPLRSQL